MNIADLKLKPYARIAALGALGVCAGVFGLYVFVAYFIRATPSSGIDQTESMVAWIALAIPAALLIGAHLVYARILMAYARDD